MSKGKHSADTNSPKSEKSILKTILKIVIFLIILILIYFVYDYLSNTTPSDVYDNPEIYEPTEKVEIETVLTVKGAEHLEITGVYINSDNPELSTVAARLKNNSDQY